MDLGHRRTDIELAALEKRIAKLYQEASEEMQGKVERYFADFVGLDARQRKALEAGEITELQYTQWRLAQIGRGKRFVALQNQLAERYTKANAVAVAYINDTTPGIYCLNRNYTAYTIERVNGNVGFTLWDEQTVKRMAVEQPDVMPYYPPKRALQRGIDLAWGKRQISAQVTTGILQGESIAALADRLQTNIPRMNRTSAVRSARTAVTNAQNAGRQDAFEQASNMGIKVYKRWVATKDGRTRHEHGKADGQIVPHDQPFDVGGEKLMFPGINTGSPWNIYNCRCRMRTVEKPGIEAEKRQMRVRDPATGRNILVDEMTYTEWEEWVKNRGC